MIISDWLTASLPEQREQSGAQPRHSSDGEHARGQRDEQGQDHAENLDDRLAEALGREQQVNPDQRREVAQFAVCAEDDPEAQRMQAEGGAHPTSRTSRSTRR
ncbi:MAG: hypothetical protein IT514_02520 [Burkholderiales bacterium]|nr:hypothetical protein [Burkholderiales bacterium]